VTRIRPSGLCSARHAYYCKRLLPIVLPTSNRHPQSLQQTRDLTGPIISCETHREFDEAKPSKPSQLITRPSFSCMSLQYHAAARIETEGYVPRENNPASLKRLPPRSCRSLALARWTCVMQATRRLLRIPRPLAARGRLLQTASAVAQSLREGVLDQGAGTLGKIALARNECG